MLGCVMQQMLSGLACTCSKALPQYFVTTPMLDLERHAHGASCNSESET